MTKGARRALRGACPYESLVGDASAPAGLDLTALSLGFEAAALRAGGGFGRPAPLWAVHRLDEQLSQPLHDGGAVRLLRAGRVGGDVDFVLLRDPLTGE